MHLVTEKIEPVTVLKGVVVPADVKFRQILVTGPPGSGKSVLVSQLGGWPEEGFLDLGQEGWWHNPQLTLRPREVHLGFPVVGHAQSMAVTDPEWLASHPAIDAARLRIPPERRGLLSVNWRGRYAFDFLLHPPAEIHAVRSERAGAGTHSIDRDVTREEVERQVATYSELALLLHRGGVNVYVRTEFGGPPLRIVGADGETATPG